ncbi:MAG: hypothetical protein KDA89_16955, partial [Planctomycetaceae bacterium]|nr:hypothetical protein [Planctomycetaceae bacterium]
ALFGPPQADGFSWIMVLFPIGHVAVGVCLTYYTLAGLLNKTEILITSDAVYVRHRPIPWRGNRVVLRESVLEVELENTGVTSSGFSVQSQQAISIHRGDGQQLVLLSGIPQRQAQYIAWHLADTLQVPLIRNGGQFSVTHNGLPNWAQRFFPGSS